MATVSGGDKFKAALGKIGEKLNSAATVQIGFLENASYSDGTNVAMVAAIQEFGSPKNHIPPRPYFRTMIKKESPHWGDDIAALLREENYSAKKTLGEMGSVVASDLQQSIVDMNAPALSPITVMLRGMRTRKNFRDLPFGERIAIASERVAAGKTNYGASDKPLVDTGHMLASVDYVVKAKDE